MVECLSDLHKSLLIYPNVLGRGQALGRVWSHAICKGTFQWSNVWPNAKDVDKTQHVCIDKFCSKMLQHYDIYAQSLTDLYVAIMKAHCYDIQCIIRTKIQEMLATSYPPDSAFEDLE